MKNIFKEVFCNRPKYNFSYLISLTISVVLALLVGAVIMLLTGYDPIACYFELIKGAFGNLRGFGDTLAKTVTLSMTGIAMAFAAKAGMFNVGGEGQLYLGAMASAIIGYVFTGLSPIIVIPIAFLSAMAAGGLYAYVPAILKVKLGISEVITTIMLNTAAISFCSYLANGPLKTTESRIAAGTPSIDPAFKLSKLIPLSNLTTSIVYAAIIALIIWYVMQKTVQGYQLKMTGENPRFAKYMGIKSDKIAIISMIVSGALCGIVGLFEIYGMHGRFIETVSNEFYFDGMLVAMIMRYNPVGIVLMSVFFAALKIGSLSMELNIGISSELILVVQSIIIFFMAAESGIAESLKNRAAEKKARKALTRAAVKGDD